MVAAVNPEIRLRGRPASASVGDQDFAVVARIDCPGQNHLLLVVRTLNAAGLVFRLRQGGQEQGGENGDDGNDNQQFDQCESRAMSCRRRPAAKAWYYLGAESRRRRALDSFHSTIFISSATGFVKSAFDRAGLPACCGPQLELVSSQPRRRRAMVAPELSRARSGWVKRTPQKFCASTIMGRRWWWCRLR